MAEKINTPLVNGYNFNVDKFVDVLNVGYQQKGEPPLNEEEVDSVYNVLEKDIGKYRDMLTNAGYEPRQFETAEGGQRVTPPFVELIKRPAKKEELVALKEKNPRYYKVNEFGQQVPMTYTEMKEAGYNDRNVLLSTLGQVGKSIAGLAGQAIDTTQMDYAGLEIFSPKNILAIWKNALPQKTRETIDSKWGEFTGRINDEVKALTSALYGALPEGTQNAIEEFSDSLSNASQKIKDSKGGEVFLVGQRIFRNPRKEMLKMTEDVYGYVFGKRPSEMAKDITDTAMKHWYSFYSERTPTATMNPRLDFTAETVTKDNVEELGKFIGTTLIESLPIYLSAFFSKSPAMSFTTIGAYSSGLRYTDLTVEQEDIDSTMKWLNATGYGAVEGIFETYLGLGKIARTLRADKTLGKSFTKSIGRKILERGKAIGLGMLEEGAEEFATDLGQDAVDVLTGVIPVEEYTLRLEEKGLSFLAGAIGGGLFAGVSIGVNDISDVVSGEKSNPLDTQHSTTQVSFNPEDNMREIELFLKNSKAARNQFLDTVGQDIKIKADVELKQLVGGSTLASYIEESVAMNISPEEIVEDLKSKFYHTPITESYARFLTEARVLPDIINLDKYGQAFERILNDTASTQDVNGYINRLTQLRNDTVGDLRAEVGTLIESEADPKVLRQKLDKLWYDYTKGIPMKLSRTDMKNVISSIRNVDSANVNDKIDSVINIMDKHITRAYTRKLRNRANEGANVMSQFEPAIGTLLSSISSGKINTKDTVKFFTQEMTPEDASGYLTTDVPQGMIEVLRNIDGKSMSDLTIDEHETLDTAISIIDTSNMRWNAKITNSERLIDVIPKILDRMETNRTNISKGLGRTLFNTWIKNVEMGTLGEVDQASTTAYLLGMELTEDKKTQIFGTPERVMYRDIEMGEATAEKVELQVYNTVVNGLGKTASDKLFGNNKKFSNNTRTITIDGKPCELTIDSIIALYLTAKRPKAKRALIDGGFHNKTRATGWKEDIDVIRRSISDKGKPIDLFETFKMKQADIDRINKIVEGNEEYFEIAQTMSYILREILYPQVNLAYERIHGKSMPFDEFYFKMMRDATEIDRKATARRFLYFTNEKPGFTRRATYSRAPLDIYNASYMFNRMVREAAHFIGTAEPIVNLQLVMTKEIRQKIKNAYGDKVSRYLDKYIEDLTTPHFSDGGLEKVVGELRSKLATGSLAFRPLVQVRQFISYLLAVGSFKRLTGGSGYKWLLPALTKEKMSYETLFNLAPSMRARAKGGAVAMYSGADVANLKSKRHLHGITMTDMATIRTIASGLYDYLESVGRTSEFEDMLNNVVNRTQPKFWFSSKTRLQRSTLGSLFTMFYSGITTTKNNLTQSIQFLHAGGDKKEFIGMLAMILLVNNGLHAIVDIINDISKGRKIKFTAGSLARRIVYKTIELSPFGRMLTYAIDRAILNERSYPMDIPVMQPFERLPEALGGISKGITEEDWKKISKNTLVGIEQADKLFTGYGLSGVFDLLEQAGHAYRAVSGETEYIQTEEQVGFEEMEKELRLHKKRIMNNTKNTMEEVLKGLFGEDE